HKHDHKNRKHNTRLEVNVTNSPVSTGKAVFEFHIPSNHEPKRATYQLFVKKEFKPKELSLTKISDNLYKAEVDVSHLSDGDYKIKFNIFEKKSKKFHPFFWARHKKDWVSFSVKKSVVVVDPGEEGNKTLLG